MKKMIPTRLAAALLAACVCAASFCTLPALAADSAGKDTYVALGDSIAYGYGLADYEKERYPQLVADAFGLELYDYAVNGMTSGGFLTLVSGSKLSPDADIYKNMREAKLITVSIGSNDVLSVLTTIFMTAAGAVQNILSDEFGIVLNTSINNPDALGMFDNGVNSFRENLPQIYAAIREINPTCGLVFTKFYNPYVGVKFGSFDFGTLCDRYICEMNDILENKGDMDYFIADAYTPMNTPGMSNVDMFSGNVDPHPNAGGHAAIAEAVKLASDAALAAMPAEVVPAETVLPETAAQETEARDDTSAENIEDTSDTEDASDTEAKPEDLVGSKAIPWGKVGLIGLAAAVFIVTACIVSSKNRKKGGR